MYTISCLSKDGENYCLLITTHKVRIYENKRKSKVKVGKRRC